MSGRKRRTELSYANLLLCLLVIFIHASAEPVSQLNRDSWQYLAVMIPWRLSAFVVQGFFFLSGVKLVLGAKEPFDTAGFYLRRAKAVVLPYVGWVFVYYCWFVFHGYYLIFLKSCQILSMMNSFRYKNLLCIVFPYKWEHVPIGKSYIC